ncbi:hypothetical protein [Microlunatus antarcticus]|uniref:Clp amino terminal domain-containing protein, pathogenicity island component n=1 Tax=Microlunatus antarcticus TaxID=53388 RepID=A0A7W5JTS9_9ACTN|nr:hypothetical protein [Microlunatus antarcticus]MBB3326073.1 hypothetical protein [Microlunatus antarcticus]
MKNLSTKAKRTVLGASMGVVAVGAAAGIAGFASAAPTPTPAAPSSGASAPAQPGPGGHGGRGHGQKDGGQLATELATKLGLDQAKVATAVQEVREANRPTTRPTPGTAPTPRDPAADDAALAKALAPKLGVDEAKVKTALDEIRAAREADRTKALDDRLAAAVKAGTLTQAEADAVKKAAEKGVIGFGGPR